jgi:hypothetical protein
MPKPAPADEVTRLASIAKRVTELDQTLSAVFSKHKYLFLDVFSRKIDLILSRSPNFEDAQVTVYDKVLLALTSNGRDLENPAAITWYATRYLSFKEYGGRSRNTQLLEQGLALPTAVSQGWSSELFCPVSQHTEL